VHEREIKTLVRNKKGIVMPEKCFSSLFLFGMQASKSTLEARMKGLEKIKVIVLEEATDITNYDSVLKLMDTVTRNKDFLMIVIFNTPEDSSHWTLSNFYKLQPLSDCTNPSITNYISQFTDEELQGYYYPVPKREDFVSIFTNLNDNPYLDEDTKKRYLRYGDKDHPDYNKHHYLTDILGLVPKGQRGLIYPNISYITLEEFLKVSKDIEGYGVDFGYSNDATVITYHKIVNNRVYTKCLLYKLGLTIHDLNKEMERLGIPKNAEIIADGAEPKSIDDLFFNYGYKNIRASVKGANSVQTQIEWLKSNYKFYDCMDETNESKILEWENFNYKYAVDRNGDSLNKPDDSRFECAILNRKRVKPDNIQDARRYFVYTHFNPNIQYIQPTSRSKLQTEL
jgi:phage terminase large subunit